mgnify:CR=1 FL=1
MTYLIDSDVTIDYLFNEPKTVALIDELRRHGVAISSISYMEVMEGVAASRAPQQARVILRRFMRGTRVLVVSRAVAGRAAELRADLRRQKRQVNERALDILIAATAIEHGRILVTRNWDHYADIPGLRLHQ